MSSVNRTRAAWNVVKMLTGNKYNHNKITHMNINDDLTDKIVNEIPHTVIACYKT